MNICLKAGIWTEGVTIAYVVRSKASYSSKKLEFPLKKNNFGLNDYLCCLAGDTKSQSTLWAAMPETISVVSSFMLIFLPKYSEQVIFMLAFFGTWTLLVVTVRCGKVLVNFRFA